jgi:hypothetical protein
VLADGRVVIEVMLGDGAGPPEIRVYDDAGVLSATYDSAPESPLGSSAAVAWVAADGHLRVLRPGTPDPLTLAAPPKQEGDAEKDLVAYELDTVDCAGPTECSVVVHDAEELGELPPGRGDVFLRVTVEEWTELASDPDENLADESTDGTTQVVWLEDDCQGLRDVDTKTIIARTCDPDLGRLELFADGELVVATSSDQVVVLDRDLDVVRSIRLRGDLVYLDHALTTVDSLLFAAHTEEPTVPDPHPGGDRPGGRYDWYLVDVPLDGSEPTQLEGPALGYHHDTNVWQWHVANV